jgi:hypothetical protein
MRPSAIRVARRWLGASSPALRPGDNFLWFIDGTFEKASLGGTPPDAVSMYVSARKRVVDIDNRSKFAPESRQALSAFQREYGSDWIVSFDGSKEGPIAEFLSGSEGISRLPAKWYHGTSQSNLDSILEKGLRPRGAGSATFVGGESNPDYVYLAVDDGNDVRFAARAAGQKTRSQPVVIEVDGRHLNPDLLRPDEDSHADSWSESLRLTGTVAYEGVVPARAIRVHLRLEDSGWVRD